ncbi:MAG: hypothetical protein ACXAC2_12785, partial [Candidatus Kariarchaeaceae archaeon]
MSANTINNTLEVTVLDTLKPTFLETPPEETTVLVGTINNNLEWNVTDLHPKIYILMVDGQTRDFPAWSNGQLIRINVDNLQPAYYNYTIIVFDQSDNFNIYTIILRVKNPLLIDTILPELPHSSIVYEGDYELISGIWTDINGTEINDGEISILLFNNVDEVILISKAPVNNGNYEI